MECGWLRRTVVGESRRIAPNAPLVSTSQFVNGHERFVPHRILPVWPRLPAKVNRKLPPPSATVTVDIVTPACFGNGCKTCSAFGGLTIRSVIHEDDKFQAPASKAIRFHAD